jgi:hypothetical protein
MRLFRRKRDSDDAEGRCPHCGEALPHGALECMMCGVDLRPLRSHAAQEDIKAVEVDPRGGPLGR